MIKAILVDDEKNALEGLMLKINKQFPDIEIIKTFQNPKNAISFINSNPPDILFLDIEMPVLSGFDVLEKINKPDFEIIFVTAYNSYAIEAFQHCAVGYVLKPIDTLELISAINHAIENIENKNALLKNNVLLDHLIKTSSQANKLMIPTNDGFLFVNINEILHLEGYDGYTKIHIKDAEVIISSYNLGKFEKMIPDNFYKCHKSHIINLHKVTQFKKEGYIVLENSNSIPLSRIKRKEFLDIFSRQQSV